MTKHYHIILFVLLSLNCILGCATFSQYPPVEKKLFSWQIPKDQIDTIKDAILKGGYKRITDDNYYSHNMSAIVTQYAKEISTPKINSRVQILLSFKETCLERVYHKHIDLVTLKEEPCPDSPFYRNLGISISNADRDDIPEINDEVNRIEEILYRKLLEVAGKENVVRGERK